MMAEMEKKKETDPLTNTIIVLFGVEGAGKTEASIFLSKALGLPKRSTGDIIRERAKSDFETSTGDACRKMLEESTYLDPDLLRELVINELLNDEVSNGLIMDGSLRTLQETEDFDETLQMAGKGNFEVNVVYLNVPREVGIQRRLNNPNKRTDDTREKLLKRTELFYQDLPRRMEIIKERYKFHEVDASLPINEVNNQILSIFKK